MLPNSRIEIGPGKPMNESIKVYIAGRGNDQDGARKRINQMSDIGFTITHDWTVYSSNIPINVLEDKKLLEKWKIAQCKYDLEGVETAEWVVCYFDDKEYPYFGTINELTYTSALKKYQKNKKLYIITPYEFGESKHTSHIFFNNEMVDKKFKSWNEFIDFAIEQTIDFTEKPYEFDELKEKFSKQEQLFRSKEIEKKYMFHRLKLRSSNTDINEYLLNKYFKNGGTHMWDINIFKYNAKEGINHELLWINPKCFSTFEEEKEFGEKLIKQKYNSMGYKYFYGINDPKNRSVKGITHFHIFIDTTDTIKCV